MNVLHANWVFLTELDSLLVGQPTDVQLANQAKVLIKNIIMAWSNENEIAPNKELIEWGNSGWKKKLAYYHQSFASIALDLVNVRVHMLITLGNQVFSAMQKSPGNENGFATTLNIVRAKIKSVSHPSDYLSNEHVLQDAILLAGIYGCAHPPKKAMTIAWDHVLPLTRQSLIFWSNELIPFYALVYLANIFLREIKK